MGQIVCTDKGTLAVEQNKVLVPPAWNKTFAWGYADLSCRLANYESDKVCFTSRPFCLVARGEYIPFQITQMGDFYLPIALPKIFADSYLKLSHFNQADRLCKSSIFLSFSLFFQFILPGPFALSR